MTKVGTNKHTAFPWAHTHRQQGSLQDLSHYMNCQNLVFSVTDKIYIHLHINMQPNLGHAFARSPSSANALCRTSVDWSPHAASSRVGRGLPATSGSMLARNPSARPAVKVT